MIFLISGNLSYDDIQFDRYNEIRITVGQHGSCDLFGQEHAMKQPAEIEGKIYFFSHFKFRNMETQHTVWAWSSFCCLIAKSRL